jgi:hypothetical protein
MIIYEGWHTYTFDLKTAPLETSGGWSGKPTALRFDPIELPNPTTIQIDFLTLTGSETVRQGDPFPVVFSASPGATVSLYYDSDTNPNNGRTPLETTPGDHLSESPGLEMIYLPIVRLVGELNLFKGTNVSWDTTGVGKGTYFISADVSDGLSTTTWYSEIAVTIE